MPGDDLCYGDLQREYGCMCTEERVCKETYASVRVCVALTVCAFHLPIVASFYEANVSQVEDTRNDLQHLSLDVTWDPNHLHGLLKDKSKKKV